MVNKKRSYDAGNKGTSESFGDPGHYSSHDCIHVLQKTPHLPKGCGIIKVAVAAGGQRAPFQPRERRSSRNEEGERA